MADTPGFVWWSLAFLLWRQAERETDRFWKWTLYAYSVGAGVFCVLQFLKNLGWIK